MQPTSVSPHAKANKQKLVWGLICLIGPSALLVGTLLIYMIVTLVSNAAPEPIPTPAPGSEAALFGEEPYAGKKVGNILLFLVGGVTVLTWLPGIIVGTILLSTRKK